MREWRADDHETFIAMNQDEQVMRHFPSLMTREESLALVTRIEEHFTQHGFGWWAIEPDAGQPVSGFIGFVGLAVPRFEADFTPCVEVGWRLRTDAWGHGYATEAATAAVDYGFEQLGLAEIVSFTTVANERSRGVMRRLGMTHDRADDFDHPLLAADDPVRPHVLYRLSREDWAAYRATRGRSR